MDTKAYLKIPVENIHSTVVATIDLSGTPVVIDQNWCLHCGNCVPVCPAGARSKVL